MAASTARASHRNPLAAHPHLTGRDRTLLTLLEDHQVLTADQITRLLFTRLRTCQVRLDKLRGLDLLDRFRFSRPYGGADPWKWVLGQAGAYFQAAAAARPAPTERAHREQTLRLSASPTLNHLLTTNEFFVRLHHAARATDDPNSPNDDERQLKRWWPERVATARFPGVQPDGHGIWTDHARTMGFFLETDLGTENLTRLLTKLNGYARLATKGGPSYPVLFWLPTPEREANLQALLRLDPPPVLVATGTHDADPAEAVWLPVDDWRRYPLWDLPGDHGPNVAANPNWLDGHLDLTDQRRSRI
jgi:hypothetical protein